VSRQPKLILLNGPAGIGKSTIAKKYIDEHPFTLIIDDDQLIAMMGGWTKHEETARNLIFELTKSMATTYLQSGHNVLIPYLLLHVRHAEEFAGVARAQGVEFFECALMIGKDESVRRLMRRGTWGEPGLPPLSQKDLPYINDLYDRMEAALKKRPDTKRIDAIKDDIDGTYRRFIATLE
jgi:predicted kinase